MIRLPKPAEGSAVRVTSDFGQLWFRADDDVMRPAVERAGVWEPGETAVIRQLVRPSCRVLDVGAHVGYFSIVAHRAASGVIIDAVEPDPFTARLCELNLFAAGADARVWTCGLGRRKGIFAFESAENNPGDSRVVVNTDVADTLVPIVAADALFPDAKFDIVKIDVQGFEREVLLGMREILRRSPAVKVLVEFFPGAIIDGGGHPMDTLKEYRAMGFAVRALVGERISDMSFDEIIAMCSKAGPQGFVTLLLFRN